MRILALGVLACQASGCGRPALHCGDTVTVGDQDTFLLALVERGDGLFARSIAGVDVGFYADETQIGQARTGKLGYAVATGRVPVGTDRIQARASFDGNDLVSQGKVLSWQRNRTIIVCDIDGTVSQTDEHTLLNDRTDTGSQPVPGSPETLQALSKKYNILWLTGRPMFLRDKTLQWLEARGYPAAVAILAPDLKDAIKVEGFKQETLARARRLYPNVMIGIGNAQTDSQAYRANGMLAIMVDDGTHRRFGAQAIPLGTWAEISRFFTANHDILSEPERLRTLLREGGMIQRPVWPARAGREN